MVNRIKELVTKNTKLQETQERFLKLSFNPVGTMKAVAENLNSAEMDQDDIDLFNALTNQ